jgi:peptide/nickel transport system permease protein
VGKYLARRLLNYAVLVFIATSMAYLLAAVSLNPRTHYEGRNPPIPTASIDRTLSAYNLNDKKPVLERYGTWLSDVVHGDLGRDWDGGSVNGNMARRMWVSGQLLLIGTILGGLLGIAAGAYAAVKQYRLPDNTLSTGAFVLLATPVFVLAILLQVLAARFNNAVGHKVFLYSGQYNPAGASGFFAHTSDRLVHLILPTITLTLAGASYLMLYQRNAMLDVLGSDYVRTARAKGLRRTTALRRHALRTALIPSVTLFTYAFATIFVGATFTEIIYGWHGMGEWFVQSIQASDTNAVAAITAFVAVLILFASLLQDIVVGILDPRVRMGR